MTIQQQLAPLCPYCGSDAVCVDSAELYHGKSYGWAWRCPTCPDVYVGCHRGTTRPLGRLADAALRRAKQAAHGAFDPLWRGRKLTRSAAYAWLAERLGIPVAECHIGMFDVEQCERVVKIMEESWGPFTTS